MGMFKKICSLKTLIYFLNLMFLCFLCFKKKNKTKIKHIFSIFLILLISFLYSERNKEKGMVKIIRTGPLLQAGLDPSVVQKGLGPPRVKAHPFFFETCSSSIH